MVQFQFTWLVNRNAYFLLAVWFFGSLTCVPAEKTERRPGHRVIAIRGRPVILQCTFPPGFGSGSSISSLVVTWQRKLNETPYIVHSFYYGKEQLDQQDNAYKGRTSMFVSEMSKGNASVRLEQVRLSDAGLYECIVNTNAGTNKSELWLDYGAIFPEPRLSISASDSSISVQYEAEGFPEPEVLWWGNQGENITTDSHTYVQKDYENGLVYLKSSYAVTAATVNVTFSLKNNLLHQHMEMPLSYTYTGKNLSWHPITGLSLFSLILLFAVCILTWKLCSKK